MGECTTELTDQMPDTLVKLEYVKPAGTTSVTCPVPVMVLALGLMLVSGCT